MNAPLENTGCSRADALEVLETRCQVTMTLVGRGSSAAVPSRRWSHCAGAGRSDPAV
jgi:hypothetical protein